MVFVVFTGQDQIGHVFHELEQVLQFIRAANRWHRIELWNKGKLKGLHLL